MISPKGHLYKILKFGMICFDNTKLQTPLKFWLAIKLIFRIDKSLKKKVSSKLRDSNVQTIRLLQKLVKSWINYSILLSIKLWIIFKTKNACPLPSRERTINNKQNIDPWIIWAPVNLS